EWATNDNTIDASWANLNGAALGVEISAGHTGPVKPVVSVDVTPASASVLVGGTVQLTATAQDAEGQPLPGRTATWTTDAPAVATVSAAGLVTGVGAGLATITATIEGKIGTASVTVTANTVPVASVVVTPGLASVPVGGTVQLTATARDAAGQPLTGRTFTWVTDAPAIATVSAAGLVTGVGAGPATITATSEGKSGTASVTVTAGGQSALMGEWSSLLPAPIVQLHLHLLPDGRTLSWGKAGTPQVWDPASGNFTAVPSSTWLFCAGHDFLPDGRLLVAGGHIADSRGLPSTNIFDFGGGGSWQAGPPMAKGRWYPTNTTLPNGEMLTVAGEDESGATVPIPEVWDGGNWRQLTTASLALPNYPRMFVAPDGRVFYAGAERQTRYLDVTGTGGWTNGPLRQFGSRSYGSAVMYEPGKILYVGGANPPTNTAEIIDLNQPSPQWTYTGSLAYARWNLNATVLPAGDVLVTSGVAGDRTNPALAVHAAELWNPATGSWTTLASSAPLLRGYHSTSLLLPDGRVLHTGGGDGAGTPDNRNYELYSPPYLFRGPRPIVTGATPDAVAYGQTLSVETPDGASIAKVTFIRIGSVTHAFDQAGRLVPLSFSQVTGGLSVSLPSSRTTAPPGPYMLFLVNGNGVPSVGRIMRLR
ncbi:MAG: Ig-like domain-containing protein, partial [Gemmatimonadales bacterium]